MKEIKLTLDAKALDRLIDGKLIKWETVAILEGGASEPVKIELKFRETPGALTVTGHDIASHNETLGMIVVALRNMEAISCRNFQRETKALEYFKHSTKGGFLAEDKLKEVVGRYRESFNG